VIVVTLYTKKNHSPSDQAIADLEQLQSQHPHQLAVVDIETSSDLQAAFSDKVPVAQIGPYRLQSPFTLQDLKVALGAAADRTDHLTRLGDEAHSRRVERGHTFSKADRISLWLSRQYMVVISAVLILYIGLPFLAPVLAKNGAVGPANVIYKIYSPLCHQLPYRSWFLYGFQPYYPRELAGIQGVATYEEVVGTDEYNVSQARKFTGIDEQGTHRTVGIRGLMPARCSHLRLDDLVRPPVHGHRSENQTIALVFVVHLWVDTHRHRWGVTTAKLD